MNIEHMKNFLIMADSDSISHASRRLFIAQSALSNQLKTLEKEVGAQLIKRDYHSYDLTESGKTFLKYARKIVETMEQAELAVSDLQDGTTGTLRISSTPSVATGFLMEYISENTKKYPRVKLRINECNTPEVIEKIKDGISEVGFIRTPFGNHGEFVTKFLVADQMAAVYKKGSYNFEDNFSLDLLQNMPLISIYRYTELLDAITEHRNYRIYYAAQCTEVSTALSLAQLGIGIALVPYSAYKNNMGLFTGLEAKIIGDSECGTKCLMIYLKNRSLSATAQNFIKLIENIIESKEI
ncbi:MAG: LysR family transcriptional regulator [Candidatus Limousia pullorum]